MRVFLLLVAMLLIASFPFISDYLAENRSGITHDKQHVYDIIDSYLKDHPGKVMAALQDYNVSKQQTTKNEVLQSVLINYADNINSNKHPVFGESGAVRIIEFFDYNCGYCRKMKDTIENVLKNENVYYSFREVPLFGESSYLATKSALAVNSINKEKYLEFNKALLSYEGTYTEEVIKDIVNDLDINIEELEKVRDGEEVQELLDSNMELFRALKINGIPIFIIGDELIEGAVDLDTIKNMIKKMESKKS